MAPQSLRARLAETDQLLSGCLPAPPVKCHKRHGRHDGGEKKTFRVEWSHRASADQAVKPSPNEPSNGACADAHLGIISAQADDFTGDESSNDSENDPPDNAN